MPSNLSTVRRSQFFAVLPILAILPAFLGGGTERWSQGLILVLMGLLIGIFPPRHSLGRPFNVIVVALLVLALTAYLPANWFTIPAWRATAVSNYGLKL